MEKEFNRGIKLGDRLSVSCACAFVTSHGLLCACQLVNLYLRKGKVHLEDCHPFWRTLEISEDLPVPYTDVDRFQAMCTEAFSSRPSIFREATVILDRLMHSEFDNLIDPPVKDNAKG